MTFVIFLVDNTPSMLQQSLVNGVCISYLAWAKQAVTQFLDGNQEPGSSEAERIKYTRCLLLTFDTPPDHVRIGWSGSEKQFKIMLQNLDATGTVTVEKALSNAFAMLNQERMAHDLDSYGYGRCSSKHLYCFVVLITNNLARPLMRDRFPALPHGAPGASWTKESFRWDQRLFALFLGQLSESTVAKELSHASPGYYPKTKAIDRMCRITGGWSRAIRHHNEMSSCVDRLLQSIEMKLIVEFVSDPKGPNNIVDISRKPCKSSITYCGNPSQAVWPFPDSYSAKGTLVPRDAHPKLRILPPSSEEPVWMDNFPVDRYVVGSSSVVTRRILSLPDNGEIWPVVVMPSRLDMEELPFGYLKRQSAEVHLHVVPYNYSVLSRLLIANKSHLAGPLPKAVQKAMAEYRSTIPPYYCGYLHCVLRDFCSRPVLEALLTIGLTERYLTHDEQECVNRARMEAIEKCQKLSDHVSERLAREETSAVQQPMETVKLARELRLDRLIERNPKTLQGRMGEGVNYYLGETIVVPQPSNGSVLPQPELTYRNLYKVHRCDLIDHYERMRDALYHPQMQGSTDTVTYQENDSAAVKDDQCDVA